MTNPMDVFNNAQLAMAAYAGLVIGKQLGSVQSHISPAPRLFLSI